MSGLEQAIRNALERAERSDPDIRARIYQSARNALDVGLRKQEISDMAVIERQRQRLEATIREIEDEELVRLRSIARFERVALEREPETPVPDPQSLSQPDPEPEFQTEAPSGRVEPTFDAPPAEQPLDAEFEEVRPAETTIRNGAPQSSESAADRMEPALEVPAALTADDPARAAAQAGNDDYLTGLSASREARPASRVQPAPAEWDEDAAEAIAPTRARRRGGIGSFLASAFVYVFLLGIIGGGVWWVYATGMVDAALKGEGDFKLVPDALRSDGGQPPAQEARLDTLRGFSGDWINIYKPGADTAAVAPRDKASLNEDRDSDGLATVITSNAPDQDGDVLISVPASLLADLAGKTSTIAVTVKSNTDAPAQIYIQCEFKTMGDCGRHRYTVTNERADELIQVKFDGKMSPSTDGHIVINSDLTGEGSSIRLYGIRVLPGR